MRHWHRVLVPLVVPTGLVAQEPVPTPSLRETAAALVQAGRANDDARSLLAAAQLLVTAQRANGGITPATGTGADSTWPEAVRQAWELDVASLLREASRLAEDHNDPATALAAAELAGNSRLGIADPVLARELRNRAEGLATTRGATGGPLWRDGYLATGQRAEYLISFRGGRITNRVDVVPNSPQADLDCSLVDGGKVTRGERLAGSCSLKWDQKTTGKVTLRIVNGGAASYFVISSN